MKTSKTISVQKFVVYSGLYLLTFGIIFFTFTLTPRQSYNFHILRLLIIFCSVVLLSKYFFYMVISPWHDVVVAYKNKRNYNGKYYQPLVSVMIPAWNEEVGLLNTVRTLLRSDYRNVELVIVNDGSTDRSHEFMMRFLQRYDAEIPESPDKIQIVYHYKENGGKGEALNTAIALSRGDILLSIDADCAVGKSTIGNFVRHFADPEVMAAVGNVRVANTKNIIEVVQYIEFLFSFYFKKAESVMNTIYIIGGAAGAFRREVFEQLGPYNTKNITEDIELSVRIQKAGMKIVYASDALVYTEGASKLRDLKKQRHRWKRGRFETFFLHGDLFFSTDKRHNKILTWIILPLAYFGEFQLALELLFVAFLYVYSILTNDFSSFISGIIVVCSMFLVQTLFEEKINRKYSLYLLSPIGWLLFYVSTFVEVSALLKSVWGLLRKQEIKWQRWQRHGIQ
ncbi:MAG TPA: glycosyltransferase family 2 protein [Candidatus Paceibacterota bacterium]|nr:glycosyltransferase family 2 protein [Candidatus Paceibacterota bacterium]